MYILPGDCLEEGGWVSTVPTLLEWTLSIPGVTQPRLGTPASASGDRPPPPPNPLHPRTGRAWAAGGCRSEKKNPK